MLVTPWDDSTMTDFASIDSQQLLDTEEGLHSMFSKALGLDNDTSVLIAIHEDVTAEMRKRQLFYEPLAKADGHDFAPVRNICRTCRQPGPPAHDKADHDFVPVRNVCRGCGQGMDVHKAVTPIATADKAPPMPIEKSVWSNLTPFVKARCVADATIAAIYMAKSLEAIEKALPELSVEQRQKMAETGIALPDGSFPIPDEAHLHAAIRLVGQAQDPQSAMNHIIERAKAMGMEDALPPAWNTGDPSQTAGQPQIGDGAHSLQVGKPSPAQSSNVKPTPGAGLGTPGGGGGDGQPTKPGMMKRLAKAVADAMGADFDADTFMKELTINLDPEFETAFVKTVAEKRYTLGPVYMPDTLDAHDEWATADDLENSAFEYFKAEDHNIYLQHSDKVAGAIVALMPWPNDVEATMIKAVDGVQKAVSTTFPAGTIYAGVQWEPWAWEMVKAGKITGFSMGGWARRLEGSPA